MIPISTTFPRIFLQSLLLTGGQHGSICSPPPSGPSGCVGPSFGFSSQVVCQTWRPSLVRNSQVHPDSPPCPGSIWCRSTSPGSQGSLSPELTSPPVDHRSWRTLLSPVTGTGLPHQRLPSLLFKKIHIFGLFSAYRGYRDMIFFLSNLLIWVSYKVWYLTWLYFKNFIFFTLNA